MALGRPAIAAGDDVVSRLGEIIDELQVSEIIVGLPLHLRGDAGPAVQEAVRLAQQVQETFGRPIMLVDERLSSVQAQANLRAAGRDSRTGRSHIDSASAIIVLQAYLDGVPARSLVEYLPELHPRRREGRPKE